MAEAIWNDIVYTEVMQSEGFVVDYAVCTTYSLDMPTLLSVPFMLGTMTDLTEATMRSPHFILETINRSAGKFAVHRNRSRPRTYGSFPSWHHSGAGSRFLLHACHVRSCQHRRY